MKKHILLVDDDADELKIFLDALRQLPGDLFKCTYANNAAHALEMLKYLTPDFIFVDFNIPKINGLEFISEMKKNESLKLSHIFIYSTHISEKLSQEAQAIGASGCIAKTNTIDKLVAELKEILTGEVMTDYIIMKEK